LDGNNQLNRGHLDSLPDPRLSSRSVLYRKRLERGRFRLPEVALAAPRLPIATASTSNARHETEDTAFPSTAC
jgi:hypothetical protein